MRFPGFCVLALSVALPFCSDAATTGDANTSVAQPSAIAQPAAFQVSTADVDTTAAFQAMVTAGTKAGGSVFLPCGHYRISAPITIGNAYGFRIYGEARGCVTITQSTPATPIFRIAGYLDHGFRIDDITATWAAPDRDPGAAIVEIVGGGGDGSEFNFELDHLVGANGSRMLSVRKGGLAWGINFHDNTRESSMTGAMIGMPSQAGIPHISIRDNYARLDGGTMTEDLLQIYACPELIAENNEVNGYGNGAFDSKKLHLFALGQTSGLIQGFNVEGIHITGGGALIFVANGGPNLQSLILRDIRLASYVDDKMPAYGIYAAAASNNSSSLEVDGLGAYAYPGSQASLGPYIADANTKISSIRAINWVKPDGTSYGHYSPDKLKPDYTGAVPVMDYDMAPTKP